MYYEDDSYYQIKCGNMGPGKKTWDNIYTMIYFELPPTESFQQCQCLDNFLEKHATKKLFYPLVGTKDFTE